MRTHFPIWLPWTLAIELVEVLLYARVWTFEKTIVGTRGIIAGLLGLNGRPNDILRTHRVALERQ